VLLDSGQADFLCRKEYHLHCKLRAWLASTSAYQVVEGLVLNPTHVGGLMCMANQAHGRTATLEPCVGQVVASNTLVGGWVGGWMQVGA
jgi:hypothetical protein